MTVTKVETSSVAVKAGEALIFKGDPRLGDGVEDIDSWYNWVLTEVGTPKVRPYLYGSDAGLCPRKNVYLEHNAWVPESKKPTSTAYMAIGVGLEDMLAQSLKRKGRLLVQGLRLQDMPKLKISGIIDLVILDHEDELALIEVKTCGTLPTEPKPEHLAQIQIYCAVSGIPKAYITYISRNVRSGYKDSLDMRSFRVDTDEDQLLYRLQIAYISKLASKLKKVPPVPSHFRKHTECHYCPFMDFCWKTRPGRGEIEAVSPLPELTVEEFIKLDEEAYAGALTLIKEIKYRKEITLKTLLSLPLTTVQETKVNEELDKSYKETKSIERERLS